MQKFIFKTSFFIAPFALLFVFSLLFYNLEGGDLLRMGCIFNQFPHYRDKFKQAQEQPLRYTPISSLPAKKKYKLLTIGDSFSEQRKSGYQNYLAKEIDVLHIDRFLNWENPLQTLFRLANGDFFDTIKVEYVVLQSVERYFVGRGFNLKENQQTNYMDICWQITHRDTSADDVPKHNFFSNQSLNFVRNTFMFFTKKDYFFDEKVYMSKLKNNYLFSVETDELLFYVEDMESLKFNNNAKDIHILNEQLNRLDSLLKAKNMTLIVLPSPDKYDLYFDFLKSPQNDKKPRFFELLGNEKKNYIYIDSKTFLQKSMPTEKDLYFYDDTHWSPVSAERIAGEILRLTDNN